MKNTLYEQWMSDYLFNENSIANENLRKAVTANGIRMSPIELVRIMYADKLFDEQECMHAYSESGNIGISILLHRITVKELFRFLIKRISSSCLVCHWKCLNGAFEKALFCQLYNILRNIEILNTYIGFLWIIRQRVMKSEINLFMGIYLLENIQNMLNMG